MHIPKPVWIYPGSPFTAEESAPSVGLPLPDRSETAIQRVADAMARYDAIVISTARHEAIRAHYLEVLTRGRKNRGRRQLGGRTLGPSGSGKTTAAIAFAEWYESLGRHAAGERPVLIVPLDRASTSKRLFSSILRVLGDGFYDRGTEETLQKRAYEALRRFRVRLVVIDEVQHLRFRSTERNDTTDTLKRILDDGVAPVMFAGTDDAAEFLNSNKQLANRLLPPCDLPPLRRSDPQDRAIFKDYVAKLDAALVETELTGTSSGLTDKRVLSCLFEVSGGVLGRVSNLVRAALARALARSADRVQVCDLSHATVSWAVAQDLVEYDPFAKGVRKRARAA
jgi:thymidine kinase